MTTNTKPTATALKANAKKLSNKVTQQLPIVPRSFGSANATDAPSHGTSRRVVGPLDGSTKMARPSSGPREIHLLIYPIPSMGLVYLPT